MGFGDAYTAQNHVDFYISNIQWEDDADRRPDEITFDYGAPAISVDSSGRFVKHEIIGGTTVRQKVGEDPVEADIGGVCKSDTAKDLDSLRDAKYGSIYSGRFLANSLRVHFASVSTSPMEDSGAVALEDEDNPTFLYTYDLSCVQVNVGVNIPDDGGLPVPEGGIPGPQGPGEGL